jgi:hypothetical protein
MSDEIEVAANNTDTEPDENDVRIEPASTDLGIYVEES